MVLLYFLLVVRSGTADSSAPGIESGKRLGQGRCLASLPGSRGALLGRLGAATLVSGSADGLDANSHLLYRTQGPATASFSSLGNCHFRDHYLPAGRLDDVEV